MSGKYDIAIIGAGPGGYVAAIRAAQLGKKVCVIEKNKAGGVCLNIGCIPSKTLIHQAELFSSLPELADLGVSFDTGGFDYSKAHAKSRRAADILSGGVNYLLKKNGVSFVSGTAAISARNKISVKSDSGTEEISADKIIIAAGSRPRELRGFEFDGKQVLSSDDILMQKALPSSIVILGAGAIGSEFAYVLSSFGVKVYLVEMLPQILPTEDPDCAALVAAAFKKKKVEMFTSTKALSVGKKTKGIVLKIEQNGKPASLEADQLLVVTGRVPNTEDIGLDKVAIKTEKGFVPVGDYYETAQKGIFAIGDVIASPLLAHVASKEGEIAVEYICGKNPEEKLDPGLIPAAVYTNPGVASFGFTEKQASDAGIKTKAFSFPYRGAGKSVAIDKKDGFVKVICNAETEEIVGCHIAGEQATELIHELLLAKKSELLPSDIAGMVHAHPTLSETNMEAMRGIEGWAIHV